MKVILDFNVLSHFQPYEHVLATWLEKEKVIPRLHSQTYFCFHYEKLKNKDLLPNRQSFLCRTRKTSLTWFLLISMLKERCKHSYSLSKQRPCHGAINNRPSNLRMAPEKYSQLCVPRTLWNLWKLFELQKVQIRWLFTKISNLPYFSQNIYKCSCTKQ